EVMRWGVFCDEVVHVNDLANEVRYGGEAQHNQASGRSDDLQGAMRTLRECVDDAERDAITKALQAERGNLSRTAKALGIDRNTLKRKMKAFGMREEEGE